MKIYGVRSSLKHLQDLFGTIRLLRNWRELRQCAQKERRGEILAKPPVLQFRNGLQIELLAGGYSNYDFLLREIYLEKCYQPTSDFIPRKGWAVIDLGGNMGFFTCQASAADTDVRVIAVEPLPLYAEVLRKNVANNGFAKALVLQGAICGDPGQIIPIGVWYTPTGELKTGTIQDNAAKVETINATGITLSEVFEKGHVEHCDLMKVDIEGAEFDLFEKIPGHLWNKIDRVVMEVHKDGARSEKELVRILEKNGFNVHLSGESTDNPLLWATKTNCDQSGASPTAGKGTGLA